MNLDNAEWDYHFYQEWEDNSYQEWEEEEWEKEEWSPKKCRGIERSTRMEVSTKEESRFTLDN